MSDADLPSIAAREAAAALVAAEAPCSLRDSEHLRDNVTCVACHARVELEANAPTWLATLLAALAESRERLEGVERERDEAQAKMGSLQAQADVALIRIVAAEQVIEAAEAMSAVRSVPDRDATIFNDLAVLRDALSAYRATTTPASRGDE